MIHIIKSSTNVLWFIDKRLSARIQIHKVKWVTLYLGSYDKNKITPRVNLLDFIHRSTTTTSMIVI